MITAKLSRIAGAEAVIAGADVGQRMGMPPYQCGADLLVRPSTTEQPLPHEPSVLDDPVASGGDSSLYGAGASGEDDDEDDEDADEEDVEDGE